jgi:hypothetical protein
MAENSIRGHRRCLLFISGKYEMRSKKGTTSVSDSEKSRRGVVAESIGRYIELSGGHASTRELPPSREAFEIQPSLEDVCAALVHLEYCWPANQPDQWGVATYGYCMECGARIDPKRMWPMRVALLCLDCQEATERRTLFSAVHGS